MAVDDVSFEVRQGEFVALLGPSGCGKSTILNMVAGLLPTHGRRIRIDGDEVSRGRSTARSATSSSATPCSPGAPSRPNIGYGLEIAGCERAERSAKVAPAIEIAGLSGFAKASRARCRAACASASRSMRTLIMEPEILLMDEPFGALDTHTKLEMHKTLLISGNASARPCCS